MYGGFYQQALEMLNGKDARIAELESQVQELSRGGEQLRRHLEEARDRLMAAEQQVGCQGVRLLDGYRDIGQEFLVPP